MEGTAEVAKMLSRSEAAAYLKVDTAKLRRYLKTGARFNGRRVLLTPDEVVGNDWRYSVETLEDFKKRCLETLCGESPTVAETKQSEQDRYAKQAARRLQDVLGR